jgi:hypothetical protein
MRKTNHTIDLKCDCCGYDGPTVLIDPDQDDDWMPRSDPPGWGQVDGSMLGQPGPDVDLCPTCVGYLRGWFKQRQREFQGKGEQANAAA